MLPLIKRISIFLIFFLVLGGIGLLFDFLTVGKYGIRSALTVSSDLAVIRVGRFYRGLKRGWLFSPIFALAFLLSPVLFIFVFGVGLYDIYRSDEVWYTDSGDRVVYRSREIDLDAIQAAIETGPTVNALSRWMNLFRGQDVILYRGGPIPDGFLSYEAATEKDAKFAASMKWRTITISGVSFFAPPPEQDQNVRLRDLEGYEAFGVEES